MMSPPEPPDPNAPYPGIRSALMLTLLAILAAGFTGIAFIDFGILAAVGIGQAIGVGAIASMGAQRVPEPQAERLGLRGLELESIPILLCLIPAFLLVSEVDNFAYDLTEATKQSDSEYAFEMNSFDESTGSGSFDGSDGSVVFGTESESPGTSVRPETNSDGSDSLPTEEPKPEGEDRDEAPAAPEELKLIDPDNPSSVLQAIVVMVGITPIVEGFLFFGVIQQGLVFRLGLVRGVAFTALFWTLLRPMAIAGIVRFLFATVAFMGLGGLLGIRPRRDALDPRTHFRRCGMGLRAVGRHRESGSPRSPRTQCRGHASPRDGERRERRTWLSGQAGRSSKRPSGRHLTKT